MFSVLHLLSNLVEDIYFFEVNTKYISSSVLKISEFSRVRSTSENSDVFNSREELYLVFSFYFILFIGYMQYLKGGAENAKTKFFGKPK